MLRPRLRVAAFFFAAASLGVALLLAAGNSDAPKPIRVEAPLGRSGGEFRVWAPPASAGAGPFPVVYFLHDLWGSDAILWRQGVAQRVAARVARGEVPPFVLVAPEGDRGFWADSWDGRRRYEHWVTAELPAQVASRWPVRSGARSRAYVGISMGGAGAVRMGLRNPHETAAVVSISGLLVPLDGAFVRDANLLMRPMIKRVLGPPDEKALRRNDPYRMLGAMSAADLGAAPPFLLFAGTEDKYRLDEASELFTKHAREKGLAVELKLAPGAHDWSYWPDVTEEGLVWAAQRLAEETPP